MNKQQNYPNIGTGCGAVAVGVAVVRVTVGCYVFYQHHVIT